MAVVRARPIVTELDQLLDAMRPLTAPGVFDGLSARIAEAHGFKALHVSGGAIARSMGVPDLGLVTLTEVAKRVAEIRLVTRCPLIVDADTGYGNAINVMRTIRELESAGAAAVHIEDQTFPKRCGQYAGKSLVAVAEMQGKIAAALAARTSTKFLIIARTDARAVEGLDGAIARANAYADAGADLVFVEAVESAGEAAAVAKLVAIRRMINMSLGGKTPLIPLTTLADMGYSLVTFSTDLQRAAAYGVRLAAAALAQYGSTESISQSMLTVDEREEAVGFAEFAALEDRFVVQQ